MSGGPSDIAARWNRGDSIESFTPAERDRLRRDFRAHPAHDNPKDREHASVMADLKALYEADYSTEPEPAVVCVNGRMVNLNGAR